MRERSEQCAAAAVASSAIPERAAALDARAEEVMRSRLRAGLEYPSDVMAGKQIGLRIAELAIERGKRRVGSAMDRQGPDRPRQVAENQPRGTGGSRVAQRLLALAGLGAGQ